MTRTKDVTEKIVTLLRNNITDPNTSRSEKGKNWIFSDYPRLDASSPRIGVDFTSGSARPYAVNSDDMIQEPRITIVTQVNVSSKFDIDDDGELEAPDEVADYLTQQVIDVLTNNISGLKSAGAYGPMGFDENKTYPGDVIQHNLDVRFRIQR